MSYIINSPSLSRINEIEGGSCFLTCSSFIIKGTSSSFLAISSKMSNCPFEFLRGRGYTLFISLSVPALAPPGNPSTKTQLLSVEAGKGAKSDVKESSGPRGGDPGCPAEEIYFSEPANSGLGLRITPALELLGMQRAKKSVSEYRSPAGDDMMSQPCREVEAS